MIIFGVSDSSRKCLGYETKIIEDFIIKLKSHISENYTPNPSKYIKYETISIWESTNKMLRVIVDLRSEPSKQLFRLKDQNYGIYIREYAQVNYINSIQQLFEDIYKLN